MAWAICVRSCNFVSAGWQAAHSWPAAGRKIATIDNPASKRLPERICFTVPSFHLAGSAPVQPNKQALTRFSCN